MVKPFSPTELVARIRAALRRRAAPERAEPTELYVLGDLTIDYVHRGVTLAGRPVLLTATEYRLLFELSVNAGQALTYERLLQRVWGLANSGDLRPMRTVVRNLRRKLGDDADNPTYIFTEPSRRLPHGEGRRAGTGAARNSLSRRHLTFSKECETIRHPDQAIVTGAFGYTGLLGPGETELVYAGGLVPLQRLLGAVRTRADHL